jgi:hypothetical protein
MQQCTRLTVYKESATAATHELERLRHENDILCSGMMLDITREEVEIYTHGIIHLEHHVEVQDTELEERVETITNLEQQLLELQV